MADKISDNWQRLEADANGNLKEVPNSTGRRTFSSHPQDHSGVDPNSWVQRAARAYKGGVGRALGMKGY